MNGLRILASYEFFSREDQEIAVAWAEVLRIYFERDTSTISVRILVSDRRVFDQGLEGLSYLSGRARGRQGQQGGNDRQNFRNGGKNP